MRPRLLPLSAALGLLVLAGCAAAAGSSNTGPARLTLEQGNYDQAITLADEALAATPDDVDLLALKVEIYQRQYDSLADNQQAAFLDRNFDEMARTARRIEALAPGSDEARDAKLNTWAVAVNGGNSLIRTGRDGAMSAVPYLTTANELLPDSTQGLLSLGLAYISSGQAAQAVAPLERATALDPDDAILASYYGRSLILADRPSEAVTVLEAAQTRFPGDDDVQTMLLNAYTRSGQTDQAMTRYEEAIARQPNNAAIRYNYGALLLEADRFDEAVEQLERATELAPDNPDAFYNLGAAYQNKAATLNTEANAATDEGAADRLYDERNENLELALPPLLRAREIVADTGDEQGFCEALFRVYTQLNRIDDATEVAECAGMSMN